MNKPLFSLIFLVAALVMLPGCQWPEWLKFPSTTSCDHCGPHDTSPCCISLGGKPVATQKSFEQKLNQLCMAQPGIQQALASIPAEQQQGFYDQLLDGMLAELLIARYVDQEGLTKLPEYKQALEDAYKMVEQQLMQNLFQSHLMKKIEKDITDEMAERYYADNRTTNAIFKRPPFLAKAGGAKIQAIEGLTETQANDLAKLAVKQDLARVAKDSQRKVQDYGLVNSRSDVDEAIRAKAVGYTAVAQVDVVKTAKNKYAVIKVTAIVPDEFKPYSDPEVQQAVKMFLLRNEMGKAVTRTIDELKQKHSAVIHRDAIAPYVKNNQPQAAPAQEQPVAARKQLVA